MTYGPDFAALACEQMREARDKAGLDRLDFAGRLVALSGYDVMPESVDNWLDDISPPASVLLAAKWIADTAPKRTPKRKSATVRRLALVR